MEGIIVRVKMDGAVIREFKFPSNLTREWDMALQESS